MTKEDVQQLNELELEKLHLISDYVNSMLELEASLSQCRLCLSKAKAIVGFANANASLIDSRDMEAVVRVQFDEKNDAFVVNSSNSANKESKSEIVNRKQQLKKNEPAKVPKNYKPFGELEPQAVKQARATTEKTIQLACELASLQKKIRELKK